MGKDMVRTGAGVWMATGTSTGAGRFVATTAAGWFDLGAAYTKFSMQVIFTTDSTTRSVALQGVVTTAGTALALCAEATTGQTVKSSTGGVAVNKLRVWSTAMSSTAATNGYTAYVTAA